MQETNFLKNLSEKNHCVDAIIVLSKILEKNIKITIEFDRS